MSENAPIYTNNFWAKWDGGDIHLLEHHLADVGACFEALLRQPTIGDRLAATGGLPSLHAATAARLCVLAALHDIGKVNVGFQTKTWSAEDRKAGGRRVNRAGHVSDIVPVLKGDDSETMGWFFNELGWDEILDWDNDNGVTVCAIFAASMSHHGEPIDLRSPKSPHPQIWRRFGGLNPREQVRRIGGLIREWFPDAFGKDAPPLPSASEFQHMFLGLCTLADWIGSDRRRFPYSAKPDAGYFQSVARPNARTALREIGLDIENQRKAADELPPDFRAARRLFAHIPNFAPNGMQKAARDIPLDKQLTIIESETGSGKTEAALWRFSRMYSERLADSLYFALPTRAAAVQIHRRVRDFVKSMLPLGELAPEPVLAVPGYIRAGDFEGERLPDYKVWWEDGHEDGRRWAAESAKRYLAAQVAVGTVDQAMMAALQVRHSHMRAACLSRSLLVVDEVHASDPYMRAIIEELLNAHLGAGGYALLMSATLGSIARMRWISRKGGFHDDNLSLEEAMATPYPAITAATAEGEESETVRVESDAKQKDVQVEVQPIMRDAERAAEIALSAAKDGAKVLIIRNTVGYARAAWQALADAAGGAGADLIFRCNGIPTLHHSRFAAVDRKALDEAVENELGRGERERRGVVVVGTQTLEQSLDIDADLLITDLCPMDVLLQRIGRLHRHSDNNSQRPAAFQQARCVVLTPFREGDLSPLLTKGGGDPNGLGTRGYVYQDLRAAELTRRIVAESAKSGVPWSIPAMNRGLVERATHPEALKVFDDMGEDWITLRNEVEGAKFSDTLTAKSVAVKRNAPFFSLPGDRADVRFISDVENKIRTRLGEDDVEVEFSPQPPSQFSDKAIQSVSIPLRWLNGNPPPAEPIAPKISDGYFEFSIGDLRFRYDNLGLRRLR